MVNLSVLTVLVTCKVICEQRLGYDSKMDESLREGELTTLGRHA